MHCWKVNIILCVFIFSKTNFPKATARRSFSTTPSSHLYIQTNLHNDQTHKAIQADGKFYDFRSDTVTAPTDEMFEVMKNASRGDDVFEASSILCYIHLILVN